MIQIESNNINKDFVLKYLINNYSGLKVVEAWGETSLFYNPENLLKRGIYFCTLKDKDGENDKASHLNRVNIFRMNFGISKKTFLEIFKTLPKRPVKGGVVEGEWKFETLNILTPHPIYGWMAWVSILNPSKDSLNSLLSLISESHNICIEKYNLLKS